MTWQNARRILCIRPDNMGDVLMTEPAMRALRNAVPGRHIALLASPSGAAVAPYLACVDEVIAYEAPWVKNDSQALPQADLDMVARLQAGRFDAAVIFTVYSQSALPAALMCRLAGVPLVLAHCRENPYRLLSNWVREGGLLDGGRHEVQRQLDLVQTVGARSTDTRMRAKAFAQDHESLDRILAGHGVYAPQDWIVLHPGATAESRRYPAARFAQAVSHLHAQAPVLVTGGKSEDELASVVCQGDPRAINLAGQLSLGQLIALIERARLLISNNSGPVHIAAATGTPVVDLYALTNPQHTPWQVANRVLNHDVPCKNCYRSVCPQGHHACLLGVEPQQVAEAARELLAAEPRQRSERDSSLSIGTACAPQGRVQNNNGSTTCIRWESTPPITTALPR